MPLTSLLSAFLNNTPIVAMLIKVDNISRPRPLFFPVFIPCFLRTDNLILPPASKSATRLTPLRLSKATPMGKIPNERGREL